LTIVVRMTVATLIVCRMVVTGGVEVPFALVLGTAARLWAFAGRRRCEENRAAAGWIWEGALTALVSPRRRGRQRRG
jgi:hypothetical protein